MVKYIVQMIDKYSGEVLDTDGEEFDTYEEAEEYIDVYGSNYSAGAEVLDLAGEPFGNPDDVDFIVEEVEE
ncbi:MAG: hypothetical protein K0B14_17920 [Anaerolineaceae bacterium]|nr:hypothetical protein [Anaerolineaceae bacterium]